MIGKSVDELLENIAEVSWLSEDEYEEYIDEQVEIFITVCRSSEIHRKIVSATYEHIQREGNKWRTSFDFEGRDKDRLTRLVPDFDIELFSAMLRRIVIEVYEEMN